MRTSTIVWTLVVLLVVLAGWYWFSTRGSTSTVGYQGQQPGTSQGVTGNQPEATPLVLATSTARGDIVVASNGMTLYHYTKDAKGKSNCYGTCATNWPPYTLSNGEELYGGNGVSGKIVTTTRTDGSQQVTYNGEPLYFWHSDTKPGDMTGEGVGGVWFVVKP